MHRHFILFKPYGYLSQFIYELKRKKKLLGELHDFPEGTMAIGRLDEDSEGLLLLTTDGNMSELVRSKKVDKEYYVQVDGIITPEAIEALQKGVEIGFDGGKYKTRPCTAFIVTEIPDFGPRAKKIRDEQLTDTVAIANTLAAELYGLNIIERRIESNKKNYKKHPASQNLKIFPLIIKKRKCLSLRSRTKVLL